MTAAADEFFGADALAMLEQLAEDRLVVGGAPATAAAGDRAARYRRWSAGNQHAHGYAEFLIALQGDSFYAVGEQLYACRPGDAFYLPAGAPHDNGYPPNWHDVEHLWISVLHQRAFFSIYLIADGVHHPVRGGRANLSMAELGFDVEACLGADLVPAHWQHRRAYAVLQLLLARIIDIGRSTTETASGPAVVVQSICEHIDRTAGAGATLTEVARLAGYSKYHFLRLFQRHAGMTVQQYVDRARRKAVRRMLAEGISKKVIAAELGFSGPPAFSRWLRKHVNDSGTWSDRDILPTVARRRSPP
jgi:AraC-like DNA-binding protein